MSKTLTQVLISALEVIVRHLKDGSIDCSDEQISSVLNELDDIDCEPNAFYSLAEQLENDPVNCGFTYTDNSMHVTFIVISKTTSRSEFQNTFDHEKGHAAVHIATSLNFSLEGEKFQYLQGEIGKQLFKGARRFLCDECTVKSVIK